MRLTDGKYTLRFLFAYGDQSGIRERLALAATVAERAKLNRDTNLAVKYDPRRDEWDTGIGRIPVTSEGVESLRRIEAAGFIAEDYLPEDVNK